jgi:BNR/Asp-box repeat
MAARTTAAAEGWRRSLVVRLSWPFYAPRKARLPLIVVIGLVLAGPTSGCGGGSERADGPAASNAVSAGAGHIHGVGSNPADDSIVIATHTGLFRAARGEQRAERVGDRYRDTMGFTVVGPDKFLGSGHPDARENLPPLLGLIRSTDAGRSWARVSLLGEADFHVLRVAGPRIYGYDATQGRLMVSVDGGRSWKERRPPAPLLDLAVDPADADRVVVTSEAGIAVSHDAGASWRPLHADRAGLLAWTRSALTLVDSRGRVHRSTDGGRTWKPVGDVGGQPAALSGHESELLVALHSNEIKASRDGGRSWTIRVRRLSSAP